MWSWYCVPLLLICRIVPFLYSYIFCSLIQIWIIDRFVQNKLCRIRKRCCIFQVFLIPKHPWSIKSSWKLFWVEVRCFWYYVLQAFCWAVHMLFRCKICMRLRWVYRLKSRIIHHMLYFIGILVKQSQNYPKLIGDQTVSIQNMYWLI
jgi:hypothetical protein